MRRLAVQSREDGYSSNKDYQTILEEDSLRIITSSDRNRLIVEQVCTASKDIANFIGFGGYLYPEKPVEIELVVSSDFQTISKKYDVPCQWFRIGLCIDSNTQLNELVTVTLSWDNAVNLNIWGFDCGRLNLPEIIVGENPTADVLNATHLSPETFYLPQDSAVNVDFDIDESTPFTIDKGAVINLKKCSYCLRELPINPDVLGSLSFHKHRAKLTNHQNECRSCKKWRINNSFNPLRTTDQLHESSVITRERKVLLREPAILQEIKDRTGAGLKSQIWEKFDRKCFYCNEPVKLNEFQLDHTRPLAYLWPIDEHATCLCAVHNNQKKDKFPVDFYTDNQLLRLSKISGLSLEELRTKDVNETELNRIVEDIVKFANEWDSRTFLAIARKITELRPQTDLIEILKDEDESVFQQLIKDLEDRPTPVV